MAFGNSKTKKEINDLIGQIDQTYWGPEERAMIDKALALTREIGDERLEYEVRVRLTASAARTGDNDTMLSSFAWCLAKHDADPGKFPTDIENGMADLMWQFKWMVGALDSSTIFSLAQCEAMLDDMESHYVKENLGLSGVLTARFQHSWSTGDIEAAKQWRTKLLATPRDEHSHCDACGRSELAGFAIEVGEPELGLKLVDEIVEGDFSCGNEPEKALSRTLVAKLRAGRAQDALDSHMRSYRLARKNPDNISIVADNMVFCAITGNEARGLAMVERHISWLAHDSLNQDGQLNMLTAIGVVLEAVVRAGHGEQVVRGADSEDLERFFGPHEGVWTAATLMPVVYGAADALAKAFDARNSNAYVSGVLARTRALLDETYDLPIATDVFLPPAQPMAQPSTPEQWLDLAEVCAYAGELDEETIEAATHALDSGDAAQRVRASFFLVGALVHMDRTAEAAQLLPVRAAALRETGRPLQAELEERAGLAMFGARTEDAEDVLRREMARLADQPGPELADVELTLAAALFSREDQQGPSKTLLESAVAHSEALPSLQSSALRALMLMSAQQGDLEEAAAIADRVLAMDVSEGFKACVLVTRARLMGGLEKYEEGAADADAAMRIYASYHAGVPVVSAAVLASALLQDAGRPEDELTRLRYALREAEQLEMATTGIRYRMGKALVATGHPEEGVEILWEVLQDEEEAEVPPAERAETVQALGQGFEAADQYGNAVSMYGRAAGLLQEAEQPVGAASMLYRKGAILRGFEMYDDALETLSQGWELLQGQEAKGLEVQILEARGFAKGGLKDPGALDDIDRAFTIVRDDPEGPHAWKLADLVDSKGRVLMDFDRRTEAVACFLQAADGYAEAGDLASAARAEHFAAQNMAEPLDRPSEAVPIWHEALAHIDRALAEGMEAPGLRDSILVKLAEALAELGRDVEAAQTRALISSESDTKPESEG